MRWMLLAVLTLHGLIHLMGFAKAFDLADLEAMAQPISRSMGVLWLVAGLTVLAAGAHLLAAPRTWWITGLLAVALSQAAIVSSWEDARFGTVANVVVLLGVIYGFASGGPLGFAARYERALAESTSSAPGRASSRSTEGAGRLTEDELDGLPDPVRRYVVASGFVGRPRVGGFRAVTRGRIRGGPDEPWMPFTAEQENLVDPPTRLFHMRARRGAVPVDVLHEYRDGRATMEVRLLSLVPLVEARGSEMDRSETVTLFNDFALMAPGALAEPWVQWEAVDDRTARGALTAAGHTVTATLVFNEHDELVDFISDDRMAASPDGRAFEARRWTTPVTGYRSFDGIRVMRRGEGRWHPSDGDDFAYVEMELEQLEVRPR